VSADTLTRVLADTSAAIQQGGASAEGVWMRLGAHQMGPERLQAFVHAVEGWREFYLLAGTAAVTLVGLLFVALSFHLDTLLHESKAHLLSAARVTFMNFIFLLVLSLMFLVPNSGPGMLAIFTIAIGAIGLVFSLVSGWRNRRQLGPTGHEKFLRRRLTITNLAFLLTLLTGWLMLSDPRPVWLYNYVSLVCLLLGNGAGASWDLLVQVGRLRRSQETKPQG
jgi:hypothetical protein